MSRNKEVLFDPVRYDYIKIPRIFFSQTYFELSLQAKVLYALMMDRILLEYGQSTHEGRIHKSPTETLARMMGIREESEMWEVINELKGAGLLRFEEEKERRVMYLLDFCANSNAGACAANKPTLPDPEACIGNEERMVTYLYSRLDYYGQCAALPELEGKIYKMITEIVCTEIMRRKEKTIRISRENWGTEEAQRLFLKLTIDDVREVTRSIIQRGEKIEKVTPYVLVSLLNRVAGKPKA